MAMESYRDITTNIPHLFLDSGAPVSTTRIKFLDFSTHMLLVEARPHDQTTLQTKLGSPNPVKMHEIS